MNFQMLAADKLTQNTKYDYDLNDQKLKVNEVEKSPSIVPFR